MVADLLLPHLRLRFFGVVFGSASTVLTVTVCFGFFALAAGPAGYRKGERDDSDRRGADEV